MALCPDCSEPIEIDEEGLGLGDIVVCEECGAELEVVDVDGPELQPVLDSADLEDDDFSDSGLHENGFQRKYKEYYEDSDD